MNTDDQIDIQEALAGDGDAYARIVQRYESQIAKLMWRFSRDPMKCEELVQDVFVEAYFSLASFKGLSPFEHWLKRIAVRVGYKCWREKKKQSSILSLSEVDNPASCTSQDGASEVEAAKILDTLLSRLGKKDRLILTLYYFESTSLNAIAEMTGWGLSKVKMRVHRARQKMKEIAEREALIEDLS